MKPILAAMLSLGVLALAGPAVAQTTTDTVSGVVVSSSADSLVIRLDDGSQRTFVTDTTSTLPSGRLADGSRVTVRFGPMDGGRSRASSVALAVGAPAERPADRPMTQEPSMREDSTINRPAQALPDTASGMPLQGRPADRPVTQEPVRHEGSATRPSGRALPNTASGMPLLMLTGLTALAGALLLRVSRRAA